MTDSSRPIEHQHPSLPFVRTFEVDHDNADDNEGVVGWYWVLVDFLGYDECDPYGPFPTEAEALVAAERDLIEAGCVGPDGKYAR